MRELDDFLTSVTNKLHTVITLDLKKDINHSIRRISIYGSREHAKQDVLGILSEITDFVNKYAIADQIDPGYSSLSYEIEEFIVNYGWEKDIGLTTSIAKKLDDLLDEFYSYYFAAHPRNLDIDTHQKVMLQVLENVILILQLTNNVKERAIAIYQMTFDQLKEYKPLTYPILIAAAIYLATREAKKPITFQDVINAFKQLGYRIPREKVIQAIETVKKTLEGF